MAKGTRPGKTGRWIILLALILFVGFCYRYFVPWPYRGTIIQASQRNEINPYLVAAVIRVESGFRPTVVSSRGAVGLMQIMPATAQWIAVKTHQGPIPAKLLTKVEVNVGLGSWYLRHLLNVYHGNEVLALAAYNSGPNTVAYWVSKGLLNPKQPHYQNIPYLETRNFVYRVLTYEHIYRIMYAWVNSTNTEAWGWLTWQS